MLLYAKFIMTKSLLKRVSLNATVEKLMVFLKRSIEVSKKIGTTLVVQLGTETS
jgi:hypothetical protein